jgi:hypothetical protein
MPLKYKPTATTGIAIISMTQKSGNNSSISCALVYALRFVELVVTKLATVGVRANPITAVTKVPRITDPVTRPAIFSHALVG